MIVLYHPVQQSHCDQIAQEFHIEDADQLDFLYFS